jgi:hypothetical protein
LFPFIIFNLKLGAIIPDEAIRAIFPFFLFHSIHILPRDTHLVHILIRESDLKYSPWIAPEQVEEFSAYFNEAQKVK